ncbi:10343_t:CDS:2, partial [Diversispora eburnea]
MSTEPEKNTPETEIKFSKEQAVVQTTASAQSEEKVEAKDSNVSLYVLEIGAQAIKVYGEVKDIVNETGGKINIVNAKQMIDQKKPILENIPGTEVEKYKKRLEEKGAKVECREPETVVEDSKGKKKVRPQSEEEARFACKRKKISPSELNSLLTQTKKQLQPLKKLSEQDQQKKKGLIEKLVTKIESLQQAQEEDSLAVSFHYEQNQKADFCHLPKMTSRGDFIINGHHKVVVFQSVRAPAVYYYFGEEENNAKKPLAIELKFLNSGLVFDFLNVLKTFAISPELLKTLFDKESLNTDDYQEAEELEIGTGTTSLPRFLFTTSKGNSYFKLGKLGRRKYNQKIELIQQLKGQTLAED